jgi:hypothetical protein
VLQDGPLGSFVQNKEDPTLASLVILWRAQFLSLFHKEQADYRYDRQRLR